LGFQKKSIKLQEQIQRSGLVENTLNKSLPLPPPDTDAVKMKDPNSVQTLEELLKALEKPLPSVAAAAAAPTSAASAASATSAVQMTQPLPRPEAKRYQAMEVNIDMTMDIPVPGPTKPPRGGFDIPQPGSDVTQRPRPAVAVGPKRGASDNLVPRLVPATVSLQAAILDAIVMTAINLFFLVCLILVTKIDILSVVASAKTDATTQISLGLLYLTIMQMYVVAARMSFGSTLGEWTFDYQLGRDEDRQKAFYPLRVAWRNVLMVLTGIILLPVISWIVGRDVAGPLTGVGLYQLRAANLG
jgi:hypothetical protein